MAHHRHTAVTMWSNAGLSAGGETWSSSRMCRTPPGWRTTMEHVTWQHVTWQPAYRSPASWCWCASTCCGIWGASGEGSSRLRTHVYHLHRRIWGISPQNKEGAEPVCCLFFSKILITKVNEISWFNAFVVVGKHCHEKRYSRCFGWWECKWSRRRGWRRLKNHNLKNSSAQNWIKQGCCPVLRLPLF